MSACTDLCIETDNIFNPVVYFPSAGMLVVIVLLLIAIVVVAVWPV